MIKLVVFDMAGTTVDEDNVVYKTVRAAINAKGYEFTQAQVQSAGAGKEKSQAIRDVLALDGEPHSDDEVAAIFQDFRQRLQTAYQDLDVREQPGASAVFAKLRAQGIKVALNTGYDRKTAQGLVDKIGWSIPGELDALVTASDVAHGRPAPDMIHRAMELTGISSPAQVVKVGDSEIDIEEGKNAACGLTFGITTGAQTESQLQTAQPTGVVHQLSDVLSHVGIDP